MAAVFNFLGVFVMTMINAGVASTIYNMVDFGGNTDQALIALCAALVAIVAWATAAWWFGIPTSESHALIAGLSGAAIAMHNSLAGIQLSEWIKVIYGLILSTLLGFLLGCCLPKVWNYPAGIWIGVGQPVFLEAHRSPEERLWPLCMERRTDRNLWAYSCWEFFLQADRTM